MSVTRRPNGKWRARYRDAGGKEHSRHFDRKADGERWLNSVKNSIARASGSIPPWLRSPPATGQRWIGNQVQLKPSTLFRYESLLRNQILPVWERVPLSAVTHTDVGEWIRRMSEAGLAPSTVRQAHRVFSLVLAEAVRDGRLPRNVATDVRLPRVGKAEKIFLTHAQVADLAGAAEPHGLIVRVLAYTGLRWGELATLRVKRVDLTRRRLLIAESMSEINGKAVFGTPKTHQRRSVPVPRFLVDPLEERVSGRDRDALCSLHRRAGCCVTTTSDAASSTERHGKLGSPASRRTNSGTPLRAWPSLRALTSRRFSGCSVTAPPR
jgi:integrase